MSGHNPPIVWHPDGTFEELTSTGIALGALPDAEFAARTKPITPGDIIILYTDGITEANNEKEEM